MAVEITISEAEKNYVELLLKALKTNERWVHTKFRMVENTLKTLLKEDGLAKYIQAFDASYGKKKLEKQMVEVQFRLMRSVLDNCTADNFEKVTRDDSGGFDKCVTTLGFW